MGEAGRTLGEIVDVFSCCLFTWQALVTVVPAFILAGAISAFMPRRIVLKALGHGASKLVAYPVAAVSGIVLSLCSCNVVPLFLSIYRSGAGIGPASTFLFAGPAINIVSMVLVFDSIGWQMGLWRAILVPAVAVASGLTMAVIFRRDGRHQDDNRAVVQLETTAAPLGRIFALLLLLTMMVIYGAWHMPLRWKITGMIALSITVATVFISAFTRRQGKEWARETWYLARTVIPVLIPAVIVIGLISAFVDIKFIDAHLGDNSLSSIVFADLFSELMYFPILAEVVFTKTMLKLGMATGPAMAILLTGSGASLPGAIIIARSIGLKRATAFILCEIVFSAGAALLFSSEVARYLCECMMNL